MKKLSSSFVLILWSGMAAAQPALRLKGLKENAPRPALHGAQKTRTPGRSHLLLQFAHNPSRVQMEQLANRGAVALSYIPDFAFSISVADSVSLDSLDDVHWIGRLDPGQKISPELQTNRERVPATVLVEFYADVDPADARAVANDAGLGIHENPDLLAHHLLVSGTAQQLMALAGWDEVAYIFPASNDLIHGTPVRACASALTSQGPVGQAIPLIGDGWDGPGLGAANLNYAFVHVTKKVPANAAEAEIVRAFDAWAKYVKVAFSPSANPAGNQTIAVLFATGAHGDAYPFVGTGVLAHTFYPFPVNPEHIAGDMHFNDAENWRIGSGLDLFSVALHETGHALGLGHSDQPGDVMYPYYRMHTVLMPDDIAAALELYAAQDGAPNPAPPPSPTPVSPLVLSILDPPTSTTSPSLSLSGTTSGGSGNVRISWSVSSGTSGVAQGSANWLIPSVPLVAGNNVITITAQDSLKNSVTSSVTVSYQPANPAPPPGHPNPSPGPDTTPPSLTILSPSTNNYTTSASTLAVSGTAQDTVGVASVTWASSNGDSGIAAGTTNWTTPPIRLYIGATTIVITAADAAGNTSWRSLTVTRAGN